LSSEATPLALVRTPFRGPASSRDAAKSDLTGIPQIDEDARQPLRKDRGRYGREGRAMNDQRSDAMSTTNNRLHGHTPLAMPVVLLQVHRSAMAETAGHYTAPAEASAAALLNHDHILWPRTSAIRPWSTSSVNRHQSGSRPTSMTFWEPRTRLRTWRALPALGMSSAAFPATPSRSQARQTNGLAQLELADAAATPPGEPGSQTDTTILSRDRQRPTSTGVFR
jgi:hypothetical protein